MKQELRKAVSAPMNAFDYTADESSFIEVTEWTNGEGWDVAIDDRHISLSMDELAAINYMTAHMMYGGKTNFHKEDEK